MHTSRVRRSSVDGDGATSRSDQPPDWNERPVVGRDRETSEREPKSTLFESQVSTFDNAGRKRTRPQALRQVMVRIRTDKTLEKKVTMLRELYLRDGSMYSRRKRSLPAFCVSGFSATRTVDEEFKHSGLVQCDIDCKEGCNEQLRCSDTRRRLRLELEGDRHVAFIFTSPSGVGLKLGVRIDPARHKASFQAVCAYFKTTYGIEADGAVGDVGRICFLSYDPDLWMNPHVIPVPVAADGADQSHEHEPEAHTLPNSSASSSSLPVSAPLHDSALLHDSIRFYRANNPEDPAAVVKRALAARKDREAGRQAFAARYGQRVDALYRRLIEKRYVPRSCERNHVLVLAVPFLFRALSVDLVRLLLGHYYDSNQQLFRDPRAQHLAEVEAHIESVAKTWLGEITLLEREVYETLEEPLSAAFRICRDLAGHSNPAPPHFFLSNDELGARIGVDSKTAWRHLLCLTEELHLISVVTKPVRSAPGVRARATEYQWNLPLSARHRNPDGQTLEAMSDSGA
jgi:hypothetical protein